MIVVSKDGSGDFESIGAAINSISESNGKNIKIFIKRGTYKEKLNIMSPYITLIGEDVKNTIITFDDYAKKRFKDGTEYRTFNSYTMFVYGHDFTCENITIENSAGDGEVVGQAIALYVEGDRARFRNCRLLGNQDTLFTGPLPEKPHDYSNFGGPMDRKERKDSRQYYEKCYIEGDIDFIFGSATAVFKRCEIFSKNKNKEVNGYIAAASTKQGTEFGYVFIDCTLKSDAKENSVYLGRPWRDYAKTVYIDCYMGKHIKDVGWNDWNKETARKECYYAEYNSYGAGAYGKTRANYAHILDKNEVQKYKVKNILCGKDGWKFDFE